MFGQSLLSAFGIACTTDTDQLFTTNQSVTSTATYQLNNATTSIPSNTYPGTASNITYAAGKFGDAAVFNGSNGDIAINTAGWAGTPASGSDPDFTISMWINWTSLSMPVGSVPLIGRNPSGQPFGVANINVYPNGSGYSISLERSVGTTGYYSSGYNTNMAYVFQTGVWYNLVIVYTGGSASRTAKVYINNSLEASYVLNTSYTATWSNDQNLGVTAGTYFNGKMDQIRFFNTALPQSAITALYNETTTTATSASVDYQLANPNSIAYYKMSDATDQLGNYNGTATNVNFNTEGKFGFAGNFSGSTSSYMEIPSGINKNNDFSWSFWINFNSFLSYYDCPIGFFTNGCDNYIRSNSTGDIRFYDGNSFLVPPSNSVSAGSWYHIVVTKSSTTGRKMYINGSVAASDSSTSNSSGGGGGRNLLGGYSSSGNPTTSVFPFDGKLDQIRIYDSAISAADVSTLYKEVECEPAAINALDHFNTVLYTGTGSSQSITNVGFAPNFVWIKDRDAANWHNLQDTIRGATKHVYSNATNAEDTTSDGLTSFDSDGFTIGGGGGFGNNGNNFVAWNWKAPLANLSTSFNGSSSKVALSGSTTLTNRTISMWINPSKSTNLTLLDNTQGKVNGVKQFGRWNMLFNYGGTNYAVWNEYNGSQYGRATFSYAFQVGTWYHIAFCVESGNNAVYVNGVSQTLSVTRGTSIGTVNLADCTLGFDRDVSSLRFEGAIDQVRIYSSALSASEVSDLYAEPAASNNTLNYPAGAGCIAAYPLQTDAVDLSGNYSGASSNVTFGQPGYLTSNTDGTITTAIAANVEAGFNIISYSGNGIAGATVGHGLGQQVKLAFFKNRTTGSTYWYVYSDELSGSTYNLYLNDASGETADNVLRGGNATTIEISNSTAVNATNNNYICYAWTSIPGYSKVGSYVGTAAAGNFQYTGFQPSWLMVKCSSAGGRDWVIFDDKRISGSSYYELYPNTNGGENGPYPDVTLNSTGFTLGTNASFSNGSGDTYIYLAIA